MQFQNKIPAVISSKVLTIGPEYRHPRGGIGAVIELYSQNFEIFNFISTYEGDSVFSKIFIFSRSLIKLFLTLLSNRKIKIIHIHGASAGSFYRKYIIFIIGRYFFKKKIIYHIHGGGFQQFYERSNSFSKRLIRSFLKKADTIVCVSQSGLQYFRLNHKTKKLIALPNIVGYPDKQKNCKPSYLLTYLFLGLISETKGIFDLIEVINTNKSKYENRIKLLIGGNGKTKELTELIKKYQIENIVNFLGWVTSKEKIAILNEANVYILPSYIENSPISILEAMSYGMAIISTNIGGIPELVKNEKNGLLIEPGNLKQIEKALDQFIMNPEMVKNYGANSKLMVQNHLPDSVINQLMDIYKSVLTHE